MPHTEQVEVAMTFGSVASVGKQVDLFLDNKNMETKFRFYNTEEELMINGEYWLLIDGNGEVYEYNLGKLLAQEKDKYKVMALTGLKDRKEKEIWEGDVVEYTYETYSGENSVVGVVSFDGEQYGLELSSQWIPLAGKENEDFEVKGNVYENPNLKID